MFVMIILWHSNIEIVILNIDSKIFTIQRLGRPVTVKWKLTSNLTSKITDWIHLPCRLIKLYFDASCDMCYCIFYNTIFTLALVVKFRWGTVNGQLSRHPIYLRSLEYDDGIRLVKINVEIRILINTLLNLCYITQKLILYWLTWLH